MYFNKAQVSVSFKRLISRKQVGKTHLERTSCLMHFLAFDAVCRKENCELLNLSPENMEGENNRKNITLEFAKLVLLDSSRRSIKQVLQLGEIGSSNKSPEKRISSNFLTVPLKKASEQSKPFFYPKRPNAPLLKMGASATGVKWGVAYHEDWSSNLPDFLSEVKASTPFTDLAVFVMRDTSLGDRVEGYIEALDAAINHRFSSRLAQFWMHRLEQEKVLARHLSEPFSDVHQPFEKFALYSQDNRTDESDETDGLKSHISYLEGILEANQIEFTPLNQER